MCMYMCVYASVYTLLEYRYWTVQKGKSEKSVKQPTLLSIFIHISLNKVQSSTIKFRARSGFNQEHILVRRKQEDASSPRRRSEDKAILEDVLGASS